MLHVGLLVDAGRILRDPLADDAQVGQRSALAEFREEGIGGRLKVYLAVAEQLVAGLVKTIGGTAPVTNGSAVFWA